MTATSSHGLVRRPALEELVEQGTRGPVTMVAASAGSGKTRLVQSWLHGRGGDRVVAWVSVERGERDAQHFWSMVVSGVIDAAPHGTRIKPLAPTPEFDGLPLVRRLLSELAALASPMVLVIDDLHELVEADALSQLAYFIEHLPDTVRVVLISRRDLQLGLHRRRLAGELTEIRSADMRFSLEETRTMLSQMGIALSSGGLTRLHDRTEGWVAGLRLAAMSLSHHSDPESFVTEFSGSERTVAAYLFDEVLANQSERVRRLLVRTSVLTRVNGALGDLLTGDPGAERELQSLADAGGFVIALDESRTWFRFHHLFADLLAVELRNTTPDEIPRLHALAAEWYADEGQILEAITHAEAAGAHEQAASLLIEHYFTLTLDGRRATARALLERLDTNAMGSFPEMATVMAAEQLVDGSLDQAAARLGLAERHAGKVPDNRKHRFAMAQMVTRISLARRLGDFRSVIDEVTAATSAEELHALSDGDVSMQGDIRALALMNLGIVETWSGRFQAGERHLAEASALAEQMRRPYLQVECQAHLASLVTWQSFTRAREAAVEVISLAERHGWGDDPVIAPALVTLGVSSMFAGEFDEADRNLSMAERTLRSELEPAVGFELRLARGALLQAQGRPAEALKSLRDAEQLGLRLVEASPLSRQLRSSTLRAMIDVGETAAVRNILETMSELERAGGEVREIAASLALAEGDPEAALAEIEPVLVSGADVPHAEVVVRCQILEAVARDALNDMDGAERALERALDLAEEDTLIFSFIHIDSREVLQRHPRHRTAHGALIDRVLDAMSGNSPRPEAIQSTPLREKLSEAELRVLGFLPTNLSAAEIASEIYTSVHTVKTHMRHIYAKLDVHSRMEAVNRARGLGLLGRSVHRA